LISNPNIRFLIESQPDLKFEIKEQGLEWSKIFGPDGSTSNGEPQVDLYFQEVGVIKDIERLKAIFDLFYQTLDHLERAGAIKPVN